MKMYYWYIRVHLCLICIIHNTIECFELDLSNQEIQDIFNIIVPIGTQKIDISNNSLASIPFDFFINMPRFEELNIASNNIENISDFAFWNLSSLTDLNLEDNCIKVIKENTLKGLVNLRNLFLMGNNIHMIEATSLYDLYKLEKLDLDKNELSFLPENVSDPSAPLINLIRVTYGYNNIQNLTADVFENINAAIYLCLRGNEIEELPNNSFARLINLRALILQHNKLQVIYEKSLQGLRNLIYLDLWSNFISYIEEKSFYDLHKLKELYIQGNDLISLPCNLFNPLNPPVEILHVWYSYNKIKNIPKNCLQCTVRRLNLTENNVKNITNFAFSNMSCLHQVDVSKNELTVINRNTLKGLISVYLLNLENNMINFIEDQSFYDLINLHRLILSQNELTI